MKVALLPGRRLGAVALRVKEPAVATVILHPAKVTTPPAAVLVVEPVQVRLAPVPGWVPMASVIEALRLFVAGFPPASSTVTTGWGVRALPVVDAPGETVKPSWVAGPAEMVMAALVAGVREPSVAVRV